MRKLWQLSIVVAIALAAGIAAAQAPATPDPGGAFDRLSPGNQKIALAIFDSQRRGRPTAATRTLSLDQIAEMKQSGTGWGELFKEMKSRGLVQDRNLGQAVSRMSHGRGATAARAEITTASGRTVVVDGHVRPDPALSGRRRSGSDPAQGDPAGATAAGHGREGGDTAAFRDPTAARGRATAAYRDPTAARGGATAAYGGATAAREGATAAGGATAARGSAGSHRGGPGK